MKEIRLTIDNNGWVDHSIPEKLNPDEIVKFIGLVAGVSEKLETMYMTSTNHSRKSREPQARPPQQPNIS